MTLHDSVRRTLDAKAADITADIDMTENSISFHREQIVIKERTLARLRDEAQQIADALELLQNISG